MAGIYCICFIVFPIAVFMNVQRGNFVNTFLDKQDVDVVKGIATCFVILAHLTIPIAASDEHSGFLTIFNPMGGMGVLLFFFVSGYGLYKGYGAKKLDAVFWKKRLVNMYVPCVMIQLLFVLIRSIGQQTFHISDIILSSLFGAWFIDVILIQYFIFFITGKAAEEKSVIWIALSFLCSIIAAGVFLKLKFNARWYNGLLLFPFGMLTAYKEESLIVYIKKKWSVFIIAATGIFMLTGGDVRTV